MSTQDNIVEGPERQTIKTKRKAKEMGYCIQHVLLNKYSKVPRTQGMRIKNEVFYHPENEETVKSKHAWKEAGRKLKEGATPVGQKHTNRYGKSMWYDVYKESDTILSKKPKLKKSKGK